MPDELAPVALADALREAIRASGLSYSRLATLARTGSGTITNFMVGRRDMTLAVASRLCLILGFGLKRVGPVLTEPLASPPMSNRKMPKNHPLPASAFNRGQGRRVDLEKGQTEPDETNPPKAPKSSTNTSRGSSRSTHKSAGNKAVEKTKSRREGPGKR